MHPTKFKVLSVFGTRPEAIKMAPIVNKLKNQPNIDSKVCVTSQHRDMQDQMLKLFNINADYDLDIMKPGQNLSYIISTATNKLQPILESFAPDIVLVQGDTTTSFVAALAAFNNRIAIGHVEAGLRSHDLHVPFPEEANRRLTGTIATWHFAPTRKSQQNLLDEGHNKERVLVTGNTVIDALLEVRDRANPAALKKTLPEHVVSIVNSGAPYVLITGHRRESFGEGFLNICRALVHLAKKHTDWHFIYPVHLNPNVQKPVYELLSEANNIHLVAPSEYESFVQLMDKCRFILTDSGGVQEEAPSLGKPVLVMRDVTERVGGIEAGTAKLVGTNFDSIIDGVEQLITDQAVYDRMAKAVNPYGDGKAAERIVNVLLQLAEQKTPVRNRETETV